MDHYAIIGHPIGHSKSPALQAAFAEQTDQSIDYQLIDSPLNAFTDSLNAFRQAGGKGCNITVPFKQQAWQLANEISAEANFAEAANTLWFTNDVIHATNTDGIGLIRDITQNQKYSLKDRRILLLGAGGAARGAIKPLLDEQPALLTIANRSVGKAHLLADKFKHYGHINSCGFPELAGKQFDLIINATSASLSEKQLALPDQLFAANGWAYDMMYAAKPTVFLHWARQQGANRCVDGLGMLVEQGAESFFIWRGIRPNTKPVLNQLRKECSQ